MHQTLVPFAPLFGHLAAVEQAPTTAHLLRAVAGTCQRDDRRIFVREAMLYCREVAALRAAEDAVEDMRDRVRSLLGEIIEGLVTTGVPDVVFDRLHQETLRHPRG